MTVISAKNLTFDYPIFEAAHYSLKRTVLALTGFQKIAPRIFRSLHSVDFDIESNERIGLYGPNGSGKTTLLRLMAGIYKPTSGQLHVDGKVTAILGMGAGTNPEMSADANIRMLLRIEEIKPTKELVDVIWEFTDIPDNFRFMPLKAFSSGMLMRVLFSVATFEKAEILLLDEWMSVMDASFQEKAERRMLDFAYSSNIMVFASHNYPLLERVCTKIFHLADGRIVKVHQVESHSACAVSDSVKHMHFRREE